MFVSFAVSSIFGLFFFLQEKTLHICNQRQGGMEKGKRRGVGEKKEETRL